MSASKMINSYIKLPNALHRSLLLPGRNPCLCGSSLLWCLWIQKPDLLSAVLPGKTLAACQEPLGTVMSQAYNSLTALDGDAEELID